jgi:hypothetical protein
MASDTASKRLVKMVKFVAKLGVLPILRKKGIKNGVNSYETMSYGF